MTRRIPTRPTAAPALAWAGLVLLGQLGLATGLCGTPGGGREALRRVAADEPTPPTLEAAERALAEGRAQEAVTAFRALLANASPDPTAAAARARLERGLARALLLADEPYAALEPLESLVRGGLPDDLVLYVEALLMHARASLAGGGTQAAQVAPYLEDARRALARVPAEQAPTLGTAWLAGEVAYVAGRYADAVAAWDEAARTSAPGAQAWYRERRAHALYQLGRFADAAQAYEALGQARGAAAAWSAAKEGEKAIAHYADLLGRTPADEALLAEALAAARYTGTQERLEALLAALSSAQPDERALWALARGRLWLQRGDPRRAREVLAAAKEGTSPGLRARLCAEEAGALLRDAAGGEAARRAAADVLLDGWRAEPGQASLAELMALMIEQDFRAAPRAWPEPSPLRRALALQRALAAALPDDPLAQANLGNVARLAGEHAEAIAALTRAVDLAGGDAATRNDLALALLAAGRVAEGEAALRQAAADEPDMLAAPQNLARIVQGRGSAGRAEARAWLLGAEARARAARLPSTVYRALALKAWRAEREAAR